MKKAILSLLVFFFYSCSNEIELDGKWVILKMTYENKEIYPETKSDKVELIYNVAGYEGAEKIEFNVVDSTVILPGFGSNRIKAIFSVSDEIIKIYDLEINNDESPNLTKNILFQDYSILTYSQSGIIGLKSNKTILKLANEKMLQRKRINELMY